MSSVAGEKDRRADGRTHTPRHCGSKAQNIPLYSKAMLAAPRNAKYSDAAKIESVTRGDVEVVPYCVDFADGDARCRFSLRRTNIKRLRENRNRPQ